jgi:uncharacterized protein
MTVFMPKIVRKVLKQLSFWLVLALIKAYQWLISSFLPAHCRYAPTCSHYAVEAFEVHGIVKGLVLTLKRLMKCHPWGGSGFDPVPQIQQIKK